MPPPEGPPVWTALKRLPPGIPPPISSMISRSVIPIGTSTRPVLLILPTSEKILVPLPLRVPILAYSSPPFRTMIGTLAQVSTLLMVVGFPQSPLCTGCGGRRRGMPRRPSIEAISAVSSPQTKAPAPRLIETSKPKPVPRMSSPSRPRSRACSSAMPRCSIASGYSVRT